MRESDILDMTMRYARMVIDDYEDLEVIFSNKMTYVHGRCYPYRKRIVYNKKYMELNYDNEEVIRYTVIEECAHLRYLKHSQDFYNLCIDLGYDVRKPPANIRYYWKYHRICGDCGNTKFYYHKPRTVCCTSCGSANVHITESGL